MGLRQRARQRARQPPASPPASPPVSPPASELRLDSKPMGGARGRSFRSRRQPRYIAVVHSAKRRGAVFWSASCFLLHLLRPAVQFFRAKYGPKYSILGGRSSPTTWNAAKNGRSAYSPPGPNTDRNTRISAGRFRTSLYWLRPPLALGPLANPAE